MAPRPKPSESRPNRPGDAGVELFPPLDPDSPIIVEGGSIIINLDARACVDHARAAVLAKLSDNIMEGKRPDGGRQRPLSKARAAEAGRESPHRGFRTGHFADNLQASPIVGDSSRAESVVKPPGDRAVFVNKEAKRGITYVGGGTEVDAVAKKALDEVVQAQLVGLNVEHEQGEPLAKDVK